MVRPMTGLVAALLMSTSMPPSRSIVAATHCLGLVRFTRIGGEGGEACPRHRGVDPTGRLVERVLLA